MGFEVTKLELELELELEYELEFNLFFVRHTMKMVAFFMVLISSISMVVEEEVFDNKFFILPIELLLLLSLSLFIHNTLIILINY